MRLILISVWFLDVILNGWHLRTIQKSKWMGQTGHWHLTAT